MNIRPIEESDRPLLTEWIAQEPDHKTNSFEFYQEPGSKTVIYEDDFGPVLAVRYSSALRIDIDFSPTADKDRIREILKHGFPDVAVQAKQQGFKEIVFSSVSKPLIAFCRLLGFSASPDYRKVL